MRGGYGKEKNTFKHIAPYGVVARGTNEFKADYFLAAGAPSEGQTWSDHFATCKRHDDHFNAYQEAHLKAFLDPASKYTGGHAHDKNDYAALGLEANQGLDALEGLD